MLVVGRGGIGGPGGFGALVPNRIRAARNRARSSALIFAFRSSVGFDEGGVWPLGGLAADWLADLLESGLNSAMAFGIRT